MEGMELIMFNNVFENKKVLITGHTGFKGAWLSAWLLELGANVIGVSDYIPTEPSLFNELSLQDRLDDVRGDVRDLSFLKNVLLDKEPDFVFHLAAQAIVSKSYEDPIHTISTNVMGTANVLESLRACTHKCVAVIITSDKCYENVEWEWGYKETDHLGGRDIYSGSKGAAEAIFHSYFCSYFDSTESPVKLASARAGNVIGGGDWASDRIVADCIRAWSKGEHVEIRSPKATRPWQHVLEPLSGYLHLASCLALSDDFCGESFNFGPKAEKNTTVVDLLSDLSEHWGETESSGVSSLFEIVDNIPFHEAGLLKLNCDKALFNLKWEASLTYKECVDLVGSWYKSFYKDSENDMYKCTLGQIRRYVDYARERQVVWTID
jgi:CDP-glucose 4,6-dehydratase